jgi:hypothetical protein
MHGRDKTLGEKKGIKGLLKDLGVDGTIRKDTLGGRGLNSYVSGQGVAEDVFSLASSVFFIHLQVF